MRRNEDLPVPLGAVLEQKYRVERVIGHGGMGVVYEGTQLALDRVVAIKVMRPSLSADADAVARFDRAALGAAWARIYGAADSHLRRSTKVMTP